MKRIGLALALMAASLAMPWTALAVDVADFQAGKKYPIMLTLHGAGELGNDNAAQLVHDFNKMWAVDSIQATHPCFVVAPQCPRDCQWLNTPWSEGSYEMDGVVISEPMKSVVGILDSLEREFNIDKNRVYVSGISMGGFGAREGCESGQAFGPDKW